MTDWHDTEFALGGGNILTNCRAGACQTPIEGITFEITLDDLTVDDDTEYQAVVTRNGITLFVGRTEITEIEDADGITAEGAGYGAWLDYNAFSTSARHLLTVGRSQTAITQRLWLVFQLRRRRRQQAGERLGHLDRGNDRHRFGVPTTLFSRRCCRNR